MAISLNELYERLSGDCRVRMEVKMQDETEHGVVFDNFLVEEMRSVSALARGMGQIWPSVLSSLNPQP